MEESEMVTATRLRDEIDEILPGLIADRRYLHENPELGCEEVVTSAFVIDRLQALGVEDIRTGINVTGVTGLIHGSAASDDPARVVLVRADMDALPIHEENDVEYRSQIDGKMHACGHDAHTAILLGLARTLMTRRNEFAGTVKLLFQPSEERGPGGAKMMIEAGVLEDPHVDACFALHMAQDAPLGTIIVKDGPLLAASDRFSIEIQGKGGHAAHPDRTVDPVVVGAHVITALQAIVSRNVDPIEPAVITVGSLHAGHAANVIPDTAQILGTVRTLNPDVQALIVKRIEEVATGVCTALGASATFDYTYGVPATINDGGAVAIVREAATAAVGADKVITPNPSMGGEDFSFFLNERPGAMFMVGSNNPDRGLIWGHHHPRFDIDEESLATGLETMTLTVLNYLERGLTVQSGNA
ncbi:MAG: amidohydrolase [Chloroflexia bacterium]|nr:amidohydrolase [Chloroflexia bacterium]